MFERRIHRRRSVELFFNKYLEGYPYLCRTLDVSDTGLLALTFVEPQFSQTRFPLELRLPGQSQALWVVARGVWRQAGRQAIEFLEIDEADRLRIAQFVHAPPS